VINEELLQEIAPNFYNSTGQNSEAKLAKSFYDRRSWRYWQFQSSVCSRILGDYHHRWQESEMVPALCKLCRNIPNAVKQIMQMKMIKRLREARQTY